MSANDSNSRIEQSAASDDSIQQVHAQLQKQKPEKADGYSMLPLVLLGLMCCAVFFGSIYLAHFSLRFDPLVYSEHANREKPGAVKVAALSRPQMGKRVFDTTCVVCHKADGKGDAAASYPPLAGSEWVTGSEERAIRIVLHGLNGPIKVGDKEYNNVMAPLGSLKDDQIANVLSYVRATWGNNAPEVQPATVAKVRADTAGRTSFWTAAELEKIP